MPRKPLAIRMLEQRRVPHSAIEFDPAIRDAVEVAGAIGERPGRVFKTLVIETDPPGPRPYLVVVPAPEVVDLKALARELGAKKLRMASHRDAERLTGLEVGGISALSLAGRPFTVLLDLRAGEEELMYVSAGERGWDVRLAVADFVALTGARFVSTGGAAPRA